VEGVAKVLKHPCIYTLSSECENGGFRLFKICVHMHVSKCIQNTFQAQIQNIHHKLLLTQFEKYPQSLESLRRVLLCECRGKWHNTHYLLSNPLTYKKTKKNSSSGKTSGFAGTFRNENIGSF